MYVIIQSFDNIKIDFITRHVIIMLSTFGHYDLFIKLSTRIILE